jgi:N-acetylneuraminate lyase
MQYRLSGIIPAVHTPMRPDGSLDPDIIPLQVQFLLDSGVDGLFVCGTTGEFASLTTEERRIAAETFARAVAGRAALIVHVGHNCLDAARALASHASEIGAAAIAACPPSYFRPADVDVLLDCCARISEGAPDLPFFYYHIPVFSRVSLSIADLLEKTAARLPALAGVKYSAPTLDEFADCINTYQGRYTMLFGVDEMLLPALSVGAHGAVGSTYNYAAPLYRRLWSAFERGDIETARLCQYRAVQFINLQRKYGGVRAGKVMMKLVGVDCGPPRLPMRPFSLQEEHALKEELAEIGFFSWKDGG